MDSLARFRLGDWTVEPPSNSISKDGVTLHVEPKVMQVLVCLADADGEVVSREVLVRSVWRDTFVSDDVLKRAISELRKALSDDARGPRYVQTVPKSGYRLLCRPVPYVAEPTAAVASREKAARPKRVGQWPRRAAAVAILFSSAALMYSAGRTALRPRIPVAIAAEPGEERNPRLSPNGKELAFAWKKEGEAKFNLYVKDLNSGSLVRLTDEEADWIYPAWSADGNSVVFARAGGKGNGVFKVSASGGREQKILDVEPAETSPDVGIMQVSVSANGEYMAYAGSPSRPRTPPQVFLVNAKSDDAWRISPPSDWCYGPQFSSDSTRLLFTCTPSEGISEIRVTELPRGSSHVVVRENVRTSHAAWANGDKQIIYSNATGLWSVAAAGGESVRILSSSGVSNPQSVRGSNRVFYELSASDSKVVMQSLGEAGERELVPGIGFNTQPTYSPDGTRIAFTSLRSGVQEIWICNADGTGFRQLTTLGASTTGTPRWSHDGRQIVFDSRANGAAAIYVTDIDGSVVRRVETAGIEAAVPSFSSDDASIYFSSPPAQPDVWKVPAQGGVPTRMTQGGGFAPIESPDKATLYFFRNNHELWSMPTGGDSATRVDLAGGVRGGFGWTLNEQGIFYLSAAQPVGRLRFYDFKTRRTRDVEDLEADWSGISISRDGAHFAYTRPIGARADILAIE